MNYFQEELVEMIYIIGKCHKNCLLASRVYCESFPNRRCQLSSEQSLRKLKIRFETTGAVSYKKKIRQKPVLNEENELNVALSITEDPHRSSAEIGNLFDIRPSSVIKLLKKNKFHPYKLILHQTLQESDFQRRVTCCQWVSRKLEENQFFFEYVLFTDETTFHNNGHVNRHNLHYYAAQNPHFTRSVDNQNRWSMNVWGGILGNYLIGPYFFRAPISLAVM